MKFLLLSTLVYITGCAVLDSEREYALTSAPISIVTGRTSYVHGEQASVTIVNRSRTAIYVTMCNRPVPKFTLQKRVPDGWQQASSMACPRVEDFDRIQPGGTYEAVVHLETDPELVTHVPGEYRLSFLLFETIGPDWNPVPDSISISNTFQLDA